MWFEGDIYCSPESPLTTHLNLTKSGKVKRAHAYKSHLLNGHGKTTKRKRGLRQAAYADSTTAPTIKRMIPYK